MKKEKIFEIIIYILIFFTILSIIIVKPFGNLVEIWNYNFANNIAKGFIPYRDFNMVITPLLSIVCGIILKFTFNQLIIMRILATILCSAIIYMIYRIFTSLNIRREVSFIFAFIIVFLFNDLFCIDYNFATLLVVLLMILIEIKLLKNNNDFFEINKNYNLLLGILAGISVTLKQTSGIFICIVLLGNKLLFVKNKEELRLYFKSFIYRLIGMLIPISIMIIYLICNGAFYDFISYTIKGVSGFSNYIPYKDLIKFNPVGILSVLVPVIFVYAWYKSIIKKRDKNIYFLLVYGLAIFIIAFPISDNIHFLIGATPAMILILYELYNMIQILYNRLFKNKKILVRKVLNCTIYFINAYIILILIIYTTDNIYNYLRDKENYSSIENYSYIRINRDLESQIKEIDNYILSSNKDIKILDASAAVYMIPINKYNKDYDMLNKGNLGESGEQRMIKEIGQNNNTQYLILNDKYPKNWQTPLDIIEYVKNSKRKMEEIGVFDIYE